jgi:hypothetical protein
MQVEAVGPRFFAEAGESFALADRLYEHDSSDKE